MKTLRLCNHARAMAMCLALLLSGAADNACAEAGSFPPSFRASFVLNAHETDIATMSWELAPLSDESYAFTTHSEAIGVARLFRDERVSEHSEWRFTDGRVQPLHYSYSRVGGNRVREVQVDFDWQKALVRNTLNGESWTMPLPTGTLDKLVYVIAMMNDLAHGMRATHYSIADGGRLKTYKLEVIGEERIDSVLGPLQTVVVERSRAGNPRLTRIWCARALAFLPVQLEHIGDAGTVQVKLKELHELE